MILEAQGSVQFHLMTAAVHMVPALVWVLIAVEYWRFLRSLDSRPTLFVLLPVFSSLFAVHYVLHAVGELVALYPGGARIEPLISEVITILGIATVAVGIHMFPLVPVDGAPVRRGALLLGYGSAALVVLVTLVPFVAPDLAGGRVAPVLRVAPMVYVFGAIGLGLWGMRHQVRRRAWRGGIGALSIRSPDAIIMAIALLCIAVILAFFAAREESSHITTAELFFHTAMALAFAVPFAVRMLGVLLPQLVLGVTLIAATGAVVFTTLRLAGTAGPAGASLVGIAGTATILLLLVPGQAWLRVTLERVLLRHERRRQSELQAAADDLRIDVPPLETSQRACDALARTMGFRGAAILLSEGGCVSSGSIDLEPLRRVWEDDAIMAKLASSSWVDASVRSLPLAARRALADSELATVLPIRSPRRFRGYLLASEALLSARPDESEVAGMSSFLDHLALVLDGAELLARTVAVERSLAHAEKLAAIGELAARIAHEIRNPITAARSLAQMLSRDPTSPSNPEHAELILTELERVERQVRGLLRFARREELDLAPTDLGEVVRETAQRFETPFAAEAIAFTVDAPAGIVARADREKVRQVLINLIENARDALAGGDADRHIELSLTGDNGGARLVVADSGPGVDEDVLPRLFEPFFSLKEHGTGLGLAIAKRTVEAHGGRIAAMQAGVGGGLRFEIELPLEPAAEGRER